MYQVSIPLSLFSAEKNLSPAEKERLATREKEKGNEVQYDLNVL